MGRDRVQHLQLARVEVPGGLAADDQDAEALLVGPERRQHDGGERPVRVEPAHILCDVVHDLAVARDQHRRHHVFARVAGRPSVEGLALAGDDLEPLRGAVVEQERRAIAAQEAQRLLADGGGDPAGVGGGDDLLGQRAEHRDLAILLERLPPQRPDLPVLRRQRAEGPGDVLRPVAPGPAEHLLAQHDGRRSARCGRRIARDHLSARIGQGAWGLALREDRQELAGHLRLLQEPLQGPVGPAVARALGSRIVPHRFRAPRPGPRRAGRRD